MSSKPTNSKPTTPAKSWLDDVEGEAVTATVEWATSINFTLSSAGVTFYGSFDDNTQTKIASQSVDGKFFVCDTALLKSTGAFSFQATSFTELLLIEIYTTATPTLVGVLKGKPLGTTDIETVNGSGIFQRK